MRDPKIESPSAAGPEAEAPIAGSPGPALSLSGIGSIVAAQVSDAIIVTDADGTVTAWNPAAEQMYGIPLGEAIGHAIVELVSTSSMEGGEVDAVTPDMLRRGDRVRSRIVHRPLLGWRVGQELIIETAVTGLTDGSSGLIGAVTINRVAGATARLEVELATLGSLAVATGRGRSRSEIADAALEVLCRATEADAGLILSTDGEFAITSHLGVGDASIDRILAYGAIGARLATVLERADASVSVDLDDAPIADDIQDALRAEGFNHVAFAGMRVTGRLVGVLGLGWKDPSPASPSGPVLLEAATLVASALENARLLAQVERGLDLERSLTARLQALVELTRLPDTAADEATIAQYLLERIVSVLGAAAGSVARIDGDRLVGLAKHKMPAVLEELQKSRPASDWGFHRRFADGSIAYVESIDEGTVSPAILEAASAVGLRSYAAFSMRDEDALRGVLIAGFRQPASELPFDDRTIEAIGRVVDISFANQRLRRIATASEERYRVVFERSPDALLVETFDNVVVDANPAAKAMFGDDLVGRPVIDLALIDDGGPEAALSQIVEQGAALWTGTGRRLDGATFPVEVEGTRLRIGGEDRILALVRDTTERQRLQQELLQAQKMEAIGLLVAGVAHELNNPLASIVAFSQLIRTDPRLPEELHHHADLLIQESNRTRRIVQNLLDFARQRPPERVPTRLPELIDRVLDLQSYTFGPNRIEAIIEIADDLPLVPLDRAQIQQVLINLTLNAAQAIRTRAERGTIGIRAEEATAEDGGRVVRVSVTDNGPGIPEHLRSRLFVPFFTTKAPGDGTGLGLSVSFGIAAGHGGSLRYEQGPENVGTTFILELPVEQDPDAAAAERVVAHAPAGTAAGSSLPDTSPGRVAGKTFRILVLDDEASIRDFLARILQRSGYESVVASDGLTALEIVRNQPPDAILCDHRMAGMSGTAFHDAVAELAPDLARRFAFMSGDVLNPELREFAIARGITLLAKPFDIDTVARTVAQILEA